MKLRSKHLLIAMLCLLVSSCDKDDADDYSYPSVLTDLVEANVNSEQLLTSIRTDAGITYTTPNQQIKADRPDTTYRCLCSYEKGADNTARIYSIETIIAPLPKPASEFEELPQDPISVVSAWRSDRYVNMLFRYLTLGAEKHTFAFSEEERVSDEKGKTTVRVRLLHQRPEADAEAFTQKRYLSLPTYPYAATCDSVALIVPTFAGDTEYHYPLR